MQYYKTRQSVFALDENNNLFFASDDEPIVWTPTEEMLPLKAVVRLGSEAFPRGSKVSIKSRVKKIVYFPFYLISLLFFRIYDRGEFVLATAAITLATLLVGGGLALGIYASNKYPVVSRTSVPSNVIVQYEDGSALSYPIKNVKPEIVKVSETGNKLEEEKK